MVARATNLRRNRKVLIDARLFSLIFVIFELLFAQKEKKNSFSNLTKFRIRLCFGNDLVS